MKRLLLIFVGLFLLLSCEKTDDTVIDSVGISPFIVSASISPDTIDTDTIGTDPNPDDVLELSVKTYATVTHPSGIENVTVQARIFAANSGSFLSSTILLDNGNDVDSTMGDGVFSGWNTFEITRSEIGTFQVEIVAEYGISYQSSAHILPLQIVRNNVPPVLSNLQAPDTVDVSTTTEFLITVQVADPNGLDDIKSVTRTTPSNNVYPLNDSGNNGDALAGDGIFSENVTLTPPPAPGSYEFRFQAFDKSNQGSNIILHTIVIVP
ncbi:MAG: hypothetical protein L0Y80_01335 [Ignavibacteriae bacterium]|nr:hypothetical protein [Ignavibacteriota bacterium]